MSLIPTERTTLGLKRRWLRRLSLRHKAWLLTAAVLVALMLVLGLGVSGLIRKSFGLIEDQAVEDSVERVREIFRQQIATQQRTTYDYAVWDDTYCYIAEPFAEYQVSNFSVAILCNHRK
jgi:sensor domain CHASE-containing protein